MWRNIVLVGFGVLAPCVAGGASAVPDGTTALRCPHAEGDVDGPFVPNEATARRVYLALRTSIEPQRHTAARTRLFVRDGGDRWTIYESAPVTRVNGGWAVVMGGGGLAITLDKCSGAVTSAHFQR